MTSAAPALRRLIPRPAKPALTAACVQQYLCFACLRCRNIAQHKSHTVTKKLQFLKLELVQVFAYRDYFVTPE